MGEIADDCYDRMFDEMDRFDGPFVNDADPWFPRRSFATRPPVATLDDFDTLPDDCSDLV